MEIILSNIFGYLASFVALLKFQFKTREHLLIANAFGALLVGTQFLLISQYSSMAMAYLILFSSLISLIFGINLKPIIKIIIILTITFLLLFFYNKSLKNWYDWLPIIAACTGRIAEFQNNQIKMRFLFLPTHILWLIYGITLNIYPTILLEIITFLSNIIGIFKILKKS